MDEEHDQQPDDQDGAEPRWLSPEERTAWLALSHLMGMLPGALDSQLQRDADLNYFEYIVMAMLSEQPDRALAMSGLSVITSGSLSRLSNVVKRLEARGYVRRGHDPDDRRVRIALLTDAGWDTLVAAAPAHVARVRELVIDAVPPDELEVLGRAARRVTAQIDPDRAVPGEAGGPDGGSAGA